MLSQEEDKGRSVPTGTASTSQQKNDDHGFCLVAP